MIQQNWRDISYLLRGSPRQRAAYNTIRKLQLPQELKEYDPILIGTIPIGVDLPQSDLDFACYAPNLRKFETFLRQKYGRCENFVTMRKEIRGKEALIGRFLYQQFSIELFGQNCPSESQDGYRHMIIEHRILQLSNEHTRLKIKRLRNSGKKTEHAFAEVLKLEGDPYLALLAIADEDDTSLLARLHAAGLI